MDEQGNYLRLSGIINQSPTYGHEVFGEKFYYATLSVPRLSGAEDLLPITLSERLMEGIPLDIGMPLTLEGQLRSYNKVIEGAGRLLITAFAQRILPPDGEENPNQVQLQGALCKLPSYRTTPFGREIADLMLAVNRAFGKSDYIPCIAWGRNAQFASRFHVGDRLRVTGRLQSREYQKLQSNGEYITRSAFEVSCFTLEAESAAPLAAPVPPAEAPLLSPEELHRPARGEAQEEAIPQNIES